MAERIPDSETLEKSLRRLLRPIIYFAVRYAQSFHLFSKVAKELFVEAAAEELTRQGERVNVSRISVLTDLYRVEVKRIFEEGKPPVKEGKSIVSQVIARWESDPGFQTKGGRAKTLSYGSVNSDFSRLCQSVSTAINPGTVLFELGRTKAITKTSRGVKLVKGENRVTVDADKGFAILERDLFSLTSAVEENLFYPVSPTNLHIHTEYDNIHSEALPEIRRWLLAEGKAFHRKAREFLAKFDLDIYPDEASRGGSRVSLGSHSLTQKN